MSAGPRVIAVQAEGPRGKEETRLGVGVVPFLRAGSLQLGVVGKLLLDAPVLRGEVGPLAPSARPPLLEPDRPSRFAADPPNLVDYGGDFVPPRGSTELHLVGHARAEATAIRRSVRVRVVEARTQRVVLEASRTFASVLPTTRFACCAAALGPLVEPTGPRRAPLPAGPLFELGERGGAGATAPPDLVARGGAIRDDARIVLEGVGPDGVIELELPGLRPLVEVDAVGMTDDVPMALETIWLDLDHGLVALVFRGEVPVLAQTLDAVQRVVVSLEARGAERSREQRLADLQRGEVVWAQNRELGAVPPPVDPEDPRIDAATVETWGSVAPEPRIPLPRFAEVSAELAEDPRARGQVLERHGLGERTWMIEERAWLERMAVEALRGDPTSSAVYGKLFADAQDALGTEAEAKVSLDDFAAAAVALDRALDPAELLEQIGWTLPFYARVERRWTREAERDPAVAERLRRRIAELEAQGGGP